LGWAALWRDDVAAGISAFEDAHRVYPEGEDRRGAGRVALWLTYSHGYIRGQLAIAGGWGERAFRLLEGLPPGPEHVWLSIATAAVRGGDTVEVRRLVREAAEIARRLSRPDLEAMGLASEGIVLVADGEVAQGMRLLATSPISAAATAASRRRRSCSARSSEGPPLCSPWRRSPSTSATPSGPGISPSATCVRVHARTERGARSRWSCWWAPA
jgi:hypothetical protein